MPSIPGLPLLAFTRRKACWQFSRPQASSISCSSPAGLSVAHFAVHDSVPSRGALGASLLPSPVKASAICSWFFCRLSFIESCVLLAAPYGLGLRPCRPTMPAADSRPTVRMNRSILSHDAVTWGGSPEVNSTAFDAQPPDLPPVCLVEVGFAVLCQLAPHRRPHHPVLVHRLAPLIHASFRPRLATTPLRFSSPSPPPGWAGDFHPLAVDHVRHTNEKAAFSAAYPLLFNSSPEALANKLLQPTSLNSPEKVSGASDNRRCRTRGSREKRPYSRRDNHRRSAHGIRSCYRTRGCSRDRPPDSSHGGTG